MSFCTTTLDCSPGSDAVGVLEMGGGSTQIAFLPDHSVYANMFPVSVGGTLYRLYAHSYLFYGQNYITDRINDHLLKQSPGVSNIYNPCLLSGGTLRSFVVFYNYMHKPIDKQEALMTVQITMINKKKMITKLGMMMIITLWW